LPEDKQTSKHGGGGRYNAILEFKEEKIKNEKEKKRRRNRKEKKNVCMWKRKKCEYV
jgi:hypothetical protein